MLYWFGRIVGDLIGDKKIVHNYGHGGAGWSLSWGCAAEATDLALEGRPARVAVIGAGVIGALDVVTVDEAVRRIRELDAQLPLDQVYVWGSVGGMPEALVEQQIDLLVGQVQPSLVD